MDPRERVEGIFLTLGDIFTPIGERAAAALAMQRMLPQKTEADWVPARRRASQFHPHPIHGGIAKIAESTSPISPAVHIVEHLWANYDLGVYASWEGDGVRVSAEVTASHQGFKGTRAMPQTLMEDHGNCPPQIEPSRFIAEFAKGAVARYLMNFTAIKHNNDYAPIS